MYICTPTLVPNTTTGIKMGISHLSKCYVLFYICEMEAWWESKPCSQLFLGLESSDMAGMASLI